MSFRPGCFNSVVGSLFRVESDSVHSLFELTNWTTIV